MIFTRDYYIDKSGPRIALMGAVHGNETCGTEAINAFASRLDSGDVKLLGGALTLIPIANFPAYQRKERFVDENLKCVFEKTVAPMTVERGIANSRSCTQ